MGTLYTVIAYGDDEHVLESAVSEALSEAGRLDRILSNYLPESDLSHVNRMAARSPAPVSDELFELLSASIAYSTESEGAFDITVGPLTKALGLYKEAGRPVNATEVRAAAKNVGYLKISLDAENKMVHFLQDGVELDPGGIGKGYTPLAWRSCLSPAFENCQARRWSLC